MQQSSRTGGFPNAGIPTVSLIIPVYNEAQVIKARLQNLQALDYPKNRLEVVFVDGGSTDGTADLIENLVKTTILSCKVVRQNRRRGFNNAIIEGFGHTSGEIISITGAETEFDPRALHLLVSRLADLGIGAASGRQMTRNIHDGFSPKLEAAYRGLYDFIRQAESNIDSAFDVKGEMCVMRRAICERLIRRADLAGAGCIDACCSFQARMDGYRAVYEPNAIYSELSPTSFRDSFKQQTRRAATLIQNMLAFKSMTLKPDFGTFGMIVMPAHFAMLLVLPFLFMLVEELLHDENRQRRCQSCQLD